MLGLRAITRRAIVHGRERPHRRAARETCDVCATNLQSQCDSKYDERADLCDDKERVEND